jgi:hypothetical protein
MLIATCVLAAGTVIIAVSSVWAIITWRENRQREARESIQERTLEAARKEFAAKESVDNRSVVAVVAVVLGALFASDWLSKRLKGE